METKKQIVARVTNEVSKRYSQRVKDLEERYKKLVTKYENLYIEKAKLKADYDDVKEKLEQQEDWIRRLQEFCNLPDAEREGAIKLYLQEKKNAAAMYSMLSMLGKYTAMIFR